VPDSVYEVNIMIMTMVLLAGECFKKVTPFGKFCTNMLYKDIAGSTILLVTYNFTKA
jgi:hypothetical protein